MAASVPMIICQLILMLTLSSASFTSTMADNADPSVGPRARDNNAINTITPNDDPLSSNSSSGGFHLPVEHKQLLAWIIGGLFLWCSIITCCILFIKRSTYFHSRTKSNQHKINISNMMGQLDQDIEYHHAGRYNTNPDTNPSTNIEEEEDDSVEQEEIINTVKTMESKRMSKTDKLVQEFKMRQCQGKLKQEVILEIDHARAPSSPVTNPVGFGLEYSVPVEYPLEYVKTPPPPPPPGIVNVDSNGNIVNVQSPGVHVNNGQTYANPNPQF